MPLLAFLPGREPETVSLLSRFAGRSVHRKPTPQIQAMPAPPPRLAITLVFTLALLAPVVGPAQTIPVGDAVDAPTLAWTSGGSAVWVGQTNVTFDTQDAAASGAILDGQEAGWKPASPDRAWFRSAGRFPRKAAMTCWNVTPTASSQWRASPERWIGNPFNSSSARDRTPCAGGM